jgi:major membrane immunogen (membrane-anchored lipoprotein)
MGSSRMSRFMRSALNKNLHRAAIALGVAASVVVLGCGDDSGLATRYKVSGKVTYKGTPVEQGGITFEPVKPPVPEGRHASGTIKDGHYSLTTAVEGDGALPGDYKVVIISTNVNMAGLAAKTGGLAHQGDADYQKEIKNSKSLVPTKYSKAESSGLTATVKSSANSIDFDLKDE